MEINATTLLAAFLSYLEGLRQERVEGFISGIDPDMPPRTLQPRTLPCLDYLSSAANIAPGREGTLATVLAAQSRSLRWGQTYTAADFGQRFMENYGWIELFGTRGHFVSERMAGGFLVLGPETVYPDHHHVAEEIYIPMTGGTEWRMAGQPFVPRDAGEVIHHASDVPHSMRTGPEPLLALYLWRGGPLAQRSTIGGA